MASVDQILLRRVLRALGLSVLSVGPQACDSLRERQEPDTGTVLPPVSGVGVTPSMAGSSGVVSGAGPAGAGGSPVLATPTRPSLQCPAQRAVDDDFASRVLDGMPQCSSEEHFNEQVVCVAGSLEIDPAESCADVRPPDECLLRLYLCGLQGLGDEVLCGPVTSPSGDCCYVVGGGCPVGRPFVVGHVARVASLLPGTGWCAPSSPVVAGLSPELRAVLAQAYRQDGVTEHASVASFSRFALQLLAHGAPAEIVESALRAASDEVRHARACLGLAAAYGGAASSPGALPTADALHDGTGALHVACSLASEGCIAETVSAQLVAAAAARATDPFVRQTLHAIAHDEAEHVELAWRALAWLLRQGEPGLREAVAAIFARAHEHVGFGARVEHDLPDEAMADHGYLALAERAQIARETLAQVVQPAARVMLAGALAEDVAAERQA